MNIDSYTAINRSILKLIEEAFEGAYDPNHTLFISPGSDTGFFGTLKGISSEIASRSLTNGGTTIASHVNHMRYSLEIANKHLSGENPYLDADFEGSWKVKGVNDGAWTELTASLRKEYEIFRGRINNKPDLSNYDILVNTLAHVVHAAYHLGAIRQLAIALKL